MDRNTRSGTSRPIGSTLQRMILPAGVATMLLIGGAVAVVSAASPVPSTSTAPSATDQAVDGTTPAARPDRRTGGTRADCPNDDADGSGGSDGSDGTEGSDGSSAPDDANDPDPTADPSPAATPLT